MVFKKGARAWRDYVRNVDRYIGQHVYGTIRNSRLPSHRDNYHSCFAVVEEGDEGGRLHIHCLHFCRSLPDDALLDPNAGRATPDRREIQAFKSSGSTVIAHRSHADLVLVMHLLKGIGAGR